MQKSIATDLTHRLVEAYAQVRMGDPLQTGHTDGPAGR